MKMITCKSVSVVIGLTRYGPVKTISEKLSAKLGRIPAKGYHVVAKWVCCVLVCFLCVLCKPNVAISAHIINLYITL